MNQQKLNGFNMLDVKKQNRSSILQLIYEEGSISRKDIAVRLGLTPAAITLLTGELIEEGLLLQVAIETASTKKGRREVLLQINSSKLVALGVNITRHKLKIICINFDNKILFEDLICTAECRLKADLVLSKVAEIFKLRLKEYNIEGAMMIAGLGVSINGVVDSEAGVSINSFLVWEEKNVSVSYILQEKLGMPVFLSNNICALAHGQRLMANKVQQGKMLFIKYGPGLGAAHSLERSVSSVFDYRAIQLGHVISDPLGTPCVCGNQGCLETIISYDFIESTLATLFSENFTPILWKLLDGSVADLSIQKIIEAYNQGEMAVEQVLDRVIFYLCRTIKDSITLFDPENVILYGELFENEKFNESLSVHLKKYTNTHTVSFSRYNMNLETIGPATTVVSLFFKNGGVFE